MIKPGCWVDTKWGPAVCIEVQPEPQPVPGTDVSRPFAFYRYEANRPIYEDGKIVGWQEPSIWVANGDYIAQEDDDPEWMVRYLRPADSTSRHVLTLRGPYGEG